MEMNNFIMKINDIGFKYSHSKNIVEKWNCIRNIYSKMMPEIIKSERVDPYFLSWEFTPIEYDAWESIRILGVIMYPQFPLLNYFIDFANPRLKIGIELDGKDFHDKGKDYNRDLKLSKLGWKIFRIEGKECFTKYNELINEDQFNEVTDKEINHWLLNTSDGVINSINMIYFDKLYLQEYHKTAIKSLNKHSLLE